MELDTWRNEFDALDEAEPVAAAFFRGLMRRAQKHGLGDGDYRAPVGLKLSRLNRPWIAEFRTLSGNETQHLRLYWGEAPEDDKSLVACLVGAKAARTPLHRSLPTQDRHIGTAMDRLAGWCRSAATTCRKLRQH
ncbi:hypothetical protein [Nocardia aurantia]|uniref:hypothetical protein n=1 Tax=Nocardia aurantia TaxID=2585199 RepID=UPI00129611DF|nr:hypothetical protein [Nocardia aurantia]